jgi:hypothetical protein
MNEVLKVCAALLVLRTWLSGGFINVGSVFKKSSMHHNKMQESIM